MQKAKKIKLFLGLLYISIIISFLLLFFSKFSISDFSSYAFIKKNTDALYTFKDSNLFLLSLSFILFTIIWVLLLGFGSPIFLAGGFLFGKWLGTLIVTFSLTVGATILYIIANKDWFKRAVHILNEMFSDSGNNNEHYDTLGISSNASETQIKKAYHKLAKTHHPDKKNGDDTEFKKITKAYEILSDPEKRVNYDRFGETMEGSQQDFFADMFSGMSMGGGFPQQSRRKPKGADITVKIKVTLEHVLSGAVKKLQLSRKVLDKAFCLRIGQVLARNKNMLV